MPDDAPQTADKPERNRSLLEAIVTEDGFADPT